jgi:isopenicillin N synthase-like dioxygenase
MHSETLDPANQKVICHSTWTLSSTRLTCPLASVATAKSNKSLFRTLYTVPSTSLRERSNSSGRAFNIGEFVNDAPQQAMPECFKGQEAHLLDFESRCRKLCHRILRLLAIGLEVGDILRNLEFLSFRDVDACYRFLQIPDTKWFSSRHKRPSGCTVRLLHYPALLAGKDFQPEVDIRAGAHSDYGEQKLLSALSGGDV